MLMMISNNTLDMVELEPRYQWVPVYCYHKALDTKGGLHQPRLNHHLANGHLTLSSH